MTHKIRATVVAMAAGIGISGCAGRAPQLVDVVQAKDRSMDFQGTATKEIQALQARQQYLASLAEQRNCGAALAAPPQAPPKRSAS